MSDRFAATNPFLDDLDRLGYTVIRKDELADLQRRVACVPADKNAAGDASTREGEESVEPADAAQPHAVTTSPAVPSDVKARAVKVLTEAFDQHLLWHMSDGQAADLAVEALAEAGLLAGGTEPSPAERSMLALVEDMNACRLTHADAYYAVENFARYGTVYEVTEDVDG